MAGGSDMLRVIRSQGPLVALLVLCVAATCYRSSFIDPTNLANILRQVSIPGLVAIGMAFVILSGGIDLSVGSIAAVASVLAARWSGDSAVAIVVPTMVGAGIGMMNGTLITRAGIQPFIATLATMLGARGLAFIVAGGKPVGADKAGVLSQIAKADLLGIPAMALIYLLTFLLAVVVAGRTRFGRALYAIGGNEEAAITMGLAVKRNKLFAYTISGALAGIAGVLLTSRIGSGQPTAAAGWELTAIAAVVIGGISLTGGVGRMSHTLYGVLILGVIPNVINLQGTLSYWYVNLITGLLLLAIVLLQSRIASRVR